MGKGEAVTELGWVDRAREVGRSALVSGERKSDRGDMAEKQERTNFALTCSLLSLYIKEKKGSVADLGIAIAAKGESSVRFR